MAGTLPIPTGMLLMLNQDFGTIVSIVLQEPRGNSLITLEFREKLAENESNYKLHFDKVVLFMAPSCHRNPARANALVDFYGISGAISTTLSKRNI